ncbi:hypothetical protein B0H66DRAFT_565720 [Apodospora peruviana]|uniref:Uncharacterized protein n=1 Tax=Apodospora peruviana TaxID=516989 RepID=A0AAE0M2M0_9PEZI|nr:hypothetical protein B0H66DRAFT_565720 [Apodospora peruviana]
MSCTLSPSASAFSAILSAFIGSVINGLTSGWFIAFGTGWIAWFAIIRVLLSGLYMFYRTVTDSWGPGPKINDNENGDNPQGAAVPMGPQQGSSQHLIAEYNNASYLGSQQQQPQPPLLPSQYQPNHVHPPPSRTCGGLSAAVWPSAAIVRGHEQPPYTSRLWRDYLKQPTYRRMHQTDLDHSVTMLGWISWSYTAVIAPITQIIFVVANADRHDIGATKLVKGLTIAVSALPLCIDPRTRYADSLGRARYTINLLTSITCLLQGAFCAFLLGTGFADIKRARPSGFQPVFVPVIYVFFACFWAFASFSVLPMRDGGRKGAGKAHWAGYILDVGMGAFAGIFLASPAIVLYLNATSGGHSGSGMADLQEYLSCETRWWRAFAAVSP